MTEHKVRIWKEPPFEGPGWQYKHDGYYNMWRGKCTCTETTQYWAWGATVGRMLEHLWKEKSNELRRSRV